VRLNRRYGVVGFPEVSCGGVWTGRISKSRIPVLIGLFRQDDLGNVHDASNVVAVHHWQDQSAGVRLYRPAGALSAGALGRLTGRASVLEPLAAPTR
jgi:hypothetical protein